MGRTVTGPLMIALMSFGKRADDPPLPFATHREERGDGILSKTHVERVVIEFPIYVYVGDIKKPLESSAFESKPERMTNQTVRSVAAYEKFCVDRFYIARFGFYLGGYPVSVLRKTFEFPLPAHVATVHPDEIVKPRFVNALPDEQQKRIRAHPAADIFQG